MFATALLWAATAAALTLPRNGPYVHAGGGALGGGAPFAVAPAWEAGAGVWFGPYDEEYALGRFTSVGVGARQDFRGGAPVTALVGEVRRGTDVLVVGWHGFVAGGALTAGGAWGALGEAGVGGRLRVRQLGTRYLGVSVRAHGGVEAIAGAIGPRAMLTVGLELSRPFRVTR